ncbi:MAG: transpeptidase family protein [Treponema sp.]|nr:transpeptidase family protein [Treponema sp.]
MNPNRFTGTRRFIIFISLFALASVVVILRYGFLMLGNQGGGRILRAEQPSGRGAVLDRNGQVLALETRLGNVTLWRPDIEDAGELSAEMGPVLEMSPEDILDRITYSQADFIYLKKRVEESTLKIIETSLAEGRLRGVNIEPMVGRIYPKGGMASQVIGFVGDENSGLAGIEYVFDRELNPGSGENLVPAPGARRNGGQVFLTLDVNVQYILESIASNIMEETKAEAVMFMAMDPRNGDILGSASLPGFDANDFRNSDENSRMDRPAIWAYEPGSVFKVFSLSALMDSGAIDENTVFVCNGHYERITSRGETITINCLGAHGPVTARDIIVYSCNAGAAYAADRLGASPFYNRIRDFGFGSRTGAGSPGETAGFLRSPERWSERSKPTIAMGQEIAVSAMQMIQAATAIANDGILVPPRIVSRIVSADGRTVRDFDAGQPRRVLKAETARAMRQYMMDVTSDIGTGWRANVEDLSLAVKTGTAQIINPLTGSYSSTDFIASCLALLPAESPSLVLYLAIVKPKGEILGGRLAAPAIREAAEELISYLGIPRGRSPQIVHSGAVVIPAIPYPAVNETVPDFTGLSKRQILPLLRREDLKIRFSGNGWVIRQEPAPGSPITEETVIRLELDE